MRRRRRPGRCGWWSALLLLLLLALGRLRPRRRSWLVPVLLRTVVRLCLRLGSIAGRRFRTIRLRTRRLRPIVLRIRPVIRWSGRRAIRLRAVVGLIRLGTVIGLCGRRAICLRAVNRLIRLGTIVGLCRRRAICLRAVIRLIRLRTLVGLCRRRAVCLRAVIRVIRLGTIVGLRRRWTVRFGAVVRLRRLIRLSRRWTVGLCGIGSARTLIWSRLVSWSVPRLVRGGIGCGLSRSSSIWLVPGLAARLISWLVCRTAHGGCRRLARRRYLDHRLSRRRSGRRTQRLYFVLRQRLSRMRGQSLLLFCERHWRRRWSRLGDYRAVHHRLRRRGHMIGGRSFRSKDALPRGGDCYSRSHRRGRNLPRVHRDGCLGNWLSGREGSLWNHRYRTLNVPVRVIDIRDSGVVIGDGGVVDVRDRAGIDRCIADVHLVYILAADVVRGHINFPRT